MANEELLDELVEVLLDALKLVIKTSDESIDVTPEFIETIKSVTARSEKILHELRR